MARELQLLTCNIGGAGVRTETLDGIEYKVCPAAMLAEGVWQGSGGKVLYRNEQLAKSVPSWNHKPVVVYHPKDRKGKHTTACAPNILRTRKIGMMLNTGHDEKLRTEVWIDPKKANSVDSRIMKKINAGEVIEVSTGVFTDNEEGGTYNGEQYDAEATNLIGDHLAILPDKVGAYPVSAGGGLLQVNADPTEPESRQLLLERSLLSHAQAIGATITGNEMSFTDTSRQIGDLLSSKYGEPGKYWNGYVCEVYPNSVVFALDDPKSRLYKLDYEVKDGEVSLKGEATEVKREVVYRANEQAYGVDATGNLVLNSLEEHMAFDKKAHLASLKESGWSDEQLKSLENISDDVLQKIEPAKKAASGEPLANNKTEPAAPTPPPVPAKPSWDEIIANADPRTREAIEEAREAADRERGELVTTLKANEAGVKFTDEFLQNKPLKELRMLAALSKGKAKTKSELEEDGFALPPTFFGAAGTGEEVTANEGESDEDKPLVANRMYEHADRYDEPKKNKKKEVA